MIHLVVTLNRVDTVEADVDGPVSASTFVGGSLVCALTHVVPNLDIFAMAKH